MDKPKIHSCIQLVRKLPPSKLDKNILGKYMNLNKKLYQI